MNPEFQTVLTVIRKETLEQFRTKRMYILGGLFAVGFLVAAILGPLLLNRDRDVLPEDIGLILYFYLVMFGGYFFTSLLALLFTADSVCGEWKDKSLFLLFSKPVKRWAVLTGKVLGAYVSVLLVIVPVYVVGVAIIMVFIGWPGAAMFGRVVGGLAVLLAGLAPYLALGTLCSAVFKTPTTSFIFAIGMRFIGFSILSAIGFFIAIAQSGFQGMQDNIWLKIFSFLDPSNLVGVASTILFPGGGAGIGLGMAPAGGNPVPGALLAMGLHTLVYLVPSYFIVNRRDYA